MSEGGSQGLAASGFSQAPSLHPLYCQGIRTQGLGQSWGSTHFHLWMLLQTLVHKTAG